MQKNRESQEDRDKRAQEAFEALEKRFEVELRALETFETLTVRLEGNKHLHLILTSVLESFIPHNLKNFFDVGWSTISDLSVRSNVSYVCKSETLKYLEFHHEAVMKWIATPNKIEALRTFVAGRTRG